MDSLTSNLASRAVLATAVAPEDLQPQDAHATTTAANEASSELLQAFKSAEHLGANSGGKSLSFRSLFTP